MALRGEVPPGAVTLLRCGGRALDQLWVEEGYALRQERPRGDDAWSQQLCRTQVGACTGGGAGGLHGRSLA